MIFKQTNSMHVFKSNDKFKIILASRRRRLIPKLDPRQSPSEQVALIAVILVLHLTFAICQLPDDIQRELNQGLAEQARIQAMRARHQQQIQARTSAGAPPAVSQPGQPAHDPNNYSYQQASPPMQYSYYQPYGDLADQNKPSAGGDGGARRAAQQQPAQQHQQQQQQQQAPINIDLNNLSIDIPNLPTPQAQIASQRPAQRRQQMMPHFGTGSNRGNHAILQPVAGTNQSPDTFAPLGRAPLEPQAQQAGPPLTEADFKDITGGENYGAPGGSDFGIPGQGAGQGAGTGTGTGRAGRGDSNSIEDVSGAPDTTDAQLREFGMPGGQQQQHQQQQVGLGQSRQDNPMAGMMSEFGIDNTGGPRGGSRKRQGAGFDPFAMAGAGGGGNGGASLPFGSDFGGLGAGVGEPGGSARRPSRPVARQGDFDFASQPSDQSEDGGGAGGGGGGPSVRAGAAPGSLQSLLGNAFPGLGGGGGGGPGSEANTGNMGLEALTRGQNEQVGGAGGRSDDMGGALDIADMGDRADSLLGGGDLAGGLGDSGGSGGGPEEGGGGGGDDQQGGGGGGDTGTDFNLAAAAAEQQPRTVPYPDGGPQFVGTLLAVTQPQSLTQQRYSPLPDKGTYQDYPAYQTGGNNFNAIPDVVDGTPRARSPLPGRYGLPASSQLAPEHRQAGGQFNYANSPLATMNANDRYSASSLDGEFDEINADTFVD